MNRPGPFILVAALGAVLIALGSSAACADPRPGTIVWSDGHKVQGDLSLSPGKSLRLFATDGRPYIVQLDEVRELRFTPEVEEMWKGFYFPNSGQAVKAYTGDVYPWRTLEAHLTLNSGKLVEGHLFAVTLYLENDDGTQKIVLLAKQTGANGTKLSDLLYPTDITFGDAAAPANVAQIDLTTANLKNMQPLVVVAKPGLAPVPATQADAAKPVWTVPVGDPSRLFFSIQADDGLHVAWPSDTDAPLDPDIQKAATAAVAAMNDFYDTRTLLGCVADGNDVYSLVMMKRMGDTAYMDAKKYPWSVVITHTKYDPDQKKILAVLDRATLIVSQTPRNTDTPPVLKEPGLLRDITLVPAPASVSTSDSRPSPSPATPQGTNP